MSNIVGACRCSFRCRRDGLEPLTPKPARIRRFHRHQPDAPLLVIGERERNRPALRIDADSFPPRIASMFAPLLDNSVWEERPLIQGAVEVLEISKMQEIVTTLANLQDAALQLPDGPERQNALREIKDFQIRLAAFVRRLCSTA